MIKKAYVHSVYKCVIVLTQDAFSWLEKDLKLTKSRICSFGTSDRIFCEFEAIIRQSIGIIFYCFIVLSFNLTEKMVT